MDFSGDSLSEIRDLDFSLGFGGARVGSAACRSVNHFFLAVRASKVRRLLQLAVLSNASSPTTTPARFSKVEVLFEGPMMEGNVVFWGLYYSWKLPPQH